MSIPFIDLKSQYKLLQSKIDQAVLDVMEHGQFILGPYVEAFENEMTDYVGCNSTVSVANGTDGLILPMMAWGIGPGDAVFLPAFTYTATAEVVVLLGATPVFVDVDPVSFNIDLNALKAEIDTVKSAGELTPKVIIAVDLFGNPAEWPALEALAEDYGLKLLDDAAQGIGGILNNKKVGQYADATSTSFFPAKPLGCYGDGGAVFTRDNELDELLRSLRFHGQGKEKYEVARIGMNSRLDAMQAAILSEKLKVLEDEMEARNRLADLYNTRLSPVAEVPFIREGARSAWAQYTLKVEKRDELQAHLKSAGIPTMVYYPYPMHLQDAYRVHGNGEGSMPVSEALSHVVMSLPMHGYMADDTANFICDEVIKFYGKGCTGSLS